MADETPDPKKVLEDLEAMAEMVMQTMEAIPDDAMSFNIPREFVYSRGKVVGLAQGLQKLLESQEHTAELVVIVQPVLKLMMDDFGQLQDEMVKIMTAA